MANTADVAIVVGPHGVSGLEVRGGLQGHSAALRLGQALLPAIAIIDAMALDFVEAGGEADLKS